MHMSVRFSKQVGKATAFGVVIVVALTSVFMVRLGVRQMNLELEAERLEFEGGTIVVPIH